MCRSPKTPAASRHAQLAQGARHAVLVVGGGHEIRRRQHLRMGVGHRHARARRLDHREVIQPVAERDTVLEREAEILRKAPERISLVRRGDVELQVVPGGGRGLD